jgi:hypothetical protein
MLRDSGSKSFIPRRKSFERHNSGSVGSAGAWGGCGGSAGEECIEAESGR